MKRFCFLLLWMFLAVPSYARGGWPQLYAETGSAYLYGVEAEALAVAALKGLKKVDKALTLGNDGTRVTLYYKGQVIKVGRKPQDKNDAEAWGKLTEEFIVAAVGKSPEASGHDFETDEIMAAEMVNILDKDSKFYADIDEANGISKYSRRRQFAARTEDGMLYLKIGAFNKQTFAEVKQALEEYAFAPALVVDLQGCPGGMAGEAVKIADLFLDGGIIASAKGKKDNEETFYNAGDGDVWQMKPVFVLVDEETASAAEILAAALQEQGRAKVIGTKTRGKGTMQKLIALENGGVLAVTEGFFLTPSGRELNNSGIVPDVCTFEMPPSKNVENLLKEQSGNCGAEKRTDNRLEMNIVKFLVKK